MLSNLSTRKFSPFTVRVTERHVCALQDAGIYLSRDGHSPVSWLTKAREITFPTEMFVEAPCCFIGAGFFQQGAHSYSKSALSHRVVSGRYCSFGANVVPIPLNHPMDRLSTCGLDYADRAFHPAGFKKVPDTTRNRPIVIGNDVWIGEGAMLKGGITIGHGAVIGARAIVTKDVPPYAVMAGSPACIRRYRFDDGTVARLLESAWWNVDPADLVTLDTVNVPAFLDGFEDLKAAGQLRPYRPRVVALHDIFRPIEGETDSADADEASALSIERQRLHEAKMAERKRLIDEKEARRQEAGRLKAGKVVAVRS